MPIGAGIYDDLTALVQKKTKAQGVIVMVLEGNRGTGFSVQASLPIVLSLPELLRRMADDIEKSFGHA